MPGIDLYSALTVLVFAMPSIYSGHVKAIEIAEYQMKHRWYAAKISDVHRRQE